MMLYWIQQCMWSDLFLHTCSFKPLLKIPVTFIEQDAPPPL